MIKSYSDKACVYDEDRNQVHWDNGNNLIKENCMRFKQHECNFSINEEKCVLYTIKNN